MSGEKDLLKLLENLSPSMSEDEYVFCTFQDSICDNFTDLEPFASVKEKEGMSLVLERKMAEIVKRKAKRVVFFVKRGIHTLFIRLEPDWDE